MSNEPRTPSHREDSLPVDGRRILSGRYEVGELIGRGGMADVHRGTDSRLGRTVAIKLLRPDLARDPQFQARFKREAQAVAALNHPSIVAIYDTGDHTMPGGTDETVRVPYIVMEFVSGHTLRDLIRAGKITIAHAVDYTLGVLGALEYSHKAGIVHRDIKPGNVMVCGDGAAVKVMDFGIARAIADSAATMTQTQAVVGTAQYLSPEQARGESVDARSDLYSAGCLLYECLTGRPPFVGDSPVSVAYQHVREVPEPASSLNPEVPDSLDSVLSKALRKNRADRFQDAAAFRRALRAARSGISVPEVHASDAATDPQHHVPVTAHPATEAFDVSPAASSTSDRDTPKTTAVRYPTEDASARASHDAVGLPLGLPPERERTAAQKSRRRTWIVTLAIFTVLILAGGGLWVYNAMNNAVPVIPTVAVPTVTSLSESDALQELYGAALRPTVERINSNSVPAGTAIGTDPNSGESVPEDSEVLLNISAGPSSVTIPEELPGRTEAAARDLLRQAGLTGVPTTTMLNNPTVPRGSVITSNPSPGQLVAVDTAVEIVVSTGKVAVPELRGLALEEARKALTDLNLGTNVQEVENGQVAPGQVTDQSNPVNAELDQGTIVTITVAKEPEAPTPSPTPSTNSPSPKPTKTKK